MINTILSSRLFGIGMIFIAYNYLLFMPGKDINEQLIISNFIIILFGTLFCFTNKNQPFNLLKTTMLFYVIFFGLAPLFEYKLGLQYYGGGGIVDNDYLYTNNIIIASMFLYRICYYYIYKITINSNHLFNRFFFSRYLANKHSSLIFLLLPLSFISLFIIIIYYSFDIKSLLFRELENGDKSYATDSKIIGLLTNVFLRPLVFNAFLTYQFMKNKIDKYTILLFAIVIIGVSPSGIPRFESATLYLSIIFLHIWITKYKGFHLNNLLLIGFVFIFPLFGLFRSFSSLGEMTFTLNQESYKGGQFDAYQQLVWVIYNDTVTYGYQLLGALLFFIPRSIWTTKPVGSGEELAVMQMFETKNISMPLLGEGYINFGYIGIFGFIIILAFITAKLDKSFWVIRDGISNSLFPLAYMQLIGLLIFIMRGDLMSGIAYSCGILASLSVIAYLLGITPSKFKI